MYQLVVIIQMTTSYVSKEWSIAKNTYQSIKHKTFLIIKAFKIIFNFLCLIPNHLPAHIQIRFKSIKVSKVQVSEFTYFYRQIIMLAAAFMFFLCQIGDYKHDERSVRFSEIEICTRIMTTFSFRHSVRVYISRFFQHLLL